MFTIPWAVTDFSEAHGATRIIRGSRRRDHDGLVGHIDRGSPAELVCDGDARGGIQDGGRGAGD